MKSLHALLVILGFLFASQVKAQMDPKDFNGDPGTWKNRDVIATLGQNEGFEIKTSEAKSSYSTPSGFTWRFKMNNNDYAIFPELTNVGKIIVHVGGGGGPAQHPDGTIVDYNVIKIQKQAKDGTWTDLSTFGKQMPKAQNDKTYEYVCQSEGPIKIRIINESGVSIWVYKMEVTPYYEEKPFVFEGNPNNWEDKTNLEKLGQKEGFNILSTETRDGASTPSGYTWRFKLANNGYVEFPELPTLGTMTMHIAGGGGAADHPNGTIRDYDYIRIQKLDKDGVTWTDLTTIGKDMPKAQNDKAFSYTCNSTEPIKIRVINESGLSIWVYNMEATPYKRNNFVFVGDPNDWEDKEDLEKLGQKEGFNVKSIESRASSSKPFGYQWRIKLDSLGYLELPELPDLGILNVYYTGGGPAPHHNYGEKMDYNHILIEKGTPDPENPERYIWTTLVSDLGKNLPKAEEGKAYAYECNSKDPVKLRIRNTFGYTIWIYGMTITAYGDDGTIPYVFKNDMPASYAGSVPLPEGEEWQSELVNVDDEGIITYNKDEDGFILPNFSHAGYKNGNVAIPDVPVVKTLTAIEGKDNTQQIQDAIDEIGAMALNADGIRGALLLKKGLYKIKGPIYIHYDGVVLRGEGNDGDPANSTVLYDYFRDTDGYSSKRNVIVLGNRTNDSWGLNKNNVENIIDDIVPVGSYKIRIAKNENYKDGDLVRIDHPCTQAWLEAVDYGDVGEGKTPWSTSTAPINYHRYVKSVKHSDTETEITLDAPVFYSLNRSLSQCTIYRFQGNSMQNIGIENLRIDMANTGIPDAQHAWNAVGFRNAENCWAKDVVALHFGQAGFFTSRSTRITMERCYSLDPVGVVTGERMYNFNNAENSQLILFKECYGRGGRHNFVSNGTSTTSGCVVYNCKSEGSRTSSEGHRIWTQGMLFDSYEDFNPISGSAALATLGFYNRYQMGSGHGWAMAHGVMWNCNMVTDHTTAEAKKNSPVGTRGQIFCEKPPTSQNYAIGCFVERESDVKTYRRSIGYVEGTNVPGLYPQSLYKAQLDERLKNYVGLGEQDKSKSENSAISIYPNPADNQITVSGAEALDKKLFDSTGRLLLKTQQSTINISDLSSGIYFLIIDNNTYKVIKK